MGDQGYLYLAAVVFSLVTYFVNNYPMLYKGVVMRLDSANLRANMMIYKEAGKANAPYVVLETEGPVGSYNRANRSLTHFLENSLPVVMCILLAGKIFAFPTFALTVLFAIGRVLHQVGYASIGYRAHAPGFMIATFSAGILEMICLLVAAKNLGLTGVGIAG